MLDAESSERQTAVEDANLYDGNCLTADVKNGLKKIKPTAPNPMLVVKIDDSNNRNEMDIMDCNPEKNALFVGLKWTF